MVHQNLGYAALALLSLGLPQLGPCPISRNGTVFLTRPGIHIILQQQPRDLAQCTNEKKALISRVCASTFLPLPIVCMWLVVYYFSFSYHVTVIPARSIGSEQIIEMTDVGMRMTGCKSMEEILFLSSSWWIMKIFSAIGLGEQLSMGKYM